ncbi:MAG: Bifunctional ligase/repressor BirA [Candidatus Dichloromethanomonas elyunquensis]|nr:MAG: Bifunctional ligase/repressor BirA [Candidatus Dichloromethanomonas elyunquensis]
MTQLRLDPDRIVKFLQTKTLGREIVRLDSVDSTNSECKRRSSEKEGLLVLSEEQTAGRGRFGRTWASPKGKGIWMSLLLKPDLPLPNIPQLTLVGAAAVYRGLEKEADYFSGQIKIKWPNDIWISNKKIGGILTEMQTGAGSVQSVILGIGLNINLAKEDFPPELRTAATSLFLEKGELFEREIIIANILNEFERFYLEFLVQRKLGEALTVCRENSAVIGKKVKVSDQEMGIEARVIDLGPQGELLVKMNNGKLASIISGEISLQIQG